MAGINQRMDTVRTRAVEIGVYLPLGAYARVRDQITDLSRARVRQLFDGLIERGQERVEPLERVVRRRGDDVQKTGRGAAKNVRRSVAKASDRSTAATAAAAPRLPRVAAPRSAADLAIPGYRSLTASDIVSRLQGLTQTDLARIYKYEESHDGRRTILDAIESKLVDLPIATYDALTVDELAPRLENLSKDELKTIRRYELDTKQRSLVVDKVDALLA